MADIDSLKIDNFSEIHNETEKLDESKTSTVDHEEETNEDPYAYLNRNDFTSEKFKIEIRGLPKFYGISEFKKLINEKLSLACVKLKTIRPGNPWAFASFRNEEDRVKALTTLDGHIWKGRTLIAKIAKPAPDPLVKKRKQDAEANDQKKKIKNDPESTILQTEKLKNSTIPYWNKSYKEQLQLKQNDMQGILKKFSYDLWKWSSTEDRNWIEDQKNKNGGLICELLNIKASPSTEGYRNKCEFTVGMDSETDLPTVGFRLGSYASGFTEVGPVQELRHIPDKMKIAVKVFESFVRSSTLGVFCPETHSGFFRQLTARLSHSTQELMLIVGIHPQDLTEEQLQSLKSDLITHFMQNNANKECNVSSLYYQAIMKRASGQDAPVAEHLMGNTHITDTINGLKFRISPEAFFQVNTLSAEILYNAAIEVGKADNNTTVLDVCCGTGSIGLCFAKHSGKVLGIEIIPQAVQDAELNAKENNITNAEFMVGAAEDLLGSVLWKIQNEKDLLAVVDPPRAGLHNRAILQLRRCSPLKRLVYISCSPKSALRNWVDLCRPESKTVKGPPFRPVKAVAVDLFPHTRHCELLVYFERVVTEDTTLALENDNKEMLVDSSTLVVTEDQQVNDKV